MTRRLAAAALALALTPALGCAPPPTERMVEVTDAMGLHAGDPVRSAGVDVGRVRSVALRGGRAWVSFVVRGDVDLVVDETCAAVESRGLVGDAMLTLSPLDGGDLLAEAGTVTACDVAPALGDATAPLVSAAAALAEFMEAAAHGEGTLARLANDPALADAVTAYLARSPCAGEAPAAAPAIVAPPATTPAP